MENINDILDKDSKNAKNSNAIDREIQKNGKKNKCTLKDVAERVGVAVYTVSRALNGKKDISEELRRKIQIVAAQMGYVPNQGARMLRDGYSKTIAVVYDDFQNPYYNILLSKFADKLYKKGYNITIFYDFESISLLHEKLMTRVLSANIDAIISLIAADEDALILNEIWKKPLAVVSSTDNIENIDVFCSDDLNGGKVATEYLINQGCKRIGYINASLQQPSGMKRYNGYRQALQNADISYDENLVVRLAETKLTVGDGLTKIMKSNPDAIFCFNDMTVLLVLQEIKAQNINTPIKIIGYDGIQRDLVLPVTITTMNVDFEQIAEDVVNTILRRINGETFDYTRKLYPVKLFEGET